MRGKEVNLRAINPSSYFGLYIILFDVNSFKYPRICLEVLPSEIKISKLQVNLKELNF